MKKHYSIIICAYIVAAFGAYLTGRLIAGWHPFLVIAIADIVGTVVIFGFSVLFNNSSVYDAYWSVAPPLIAMYWVFSATPSIGGFRKIILMVLVLIWAFRLTLNWAVRWRGMADEDWRYADMRRKHGKAYWLVSFFGIHMMPTVLVFLGCLPFISSFTIPETNFVFLDGIAVLVTAGAIWIEWRADRDVTLFRRSNHGREGLLQSGVWSLSRHPNYLGEISFWWGVYLFGVAANGRYWWTILGPLFMTALFLCISIPMIEKRLLGRKPGYKRYIETTPMLLPRFRVKNDPRELREEF